MLLYYHQVLHVLVVAGCYFMPCYAAIGENCSVSICIGVGEICNETTSTCVCSSTHNKRGSVCQQIPNDDVPIAIVAVTTVVVTILIIITVIVIIRARRGQKSQKPDICQLPLSDPVVYKPRPIRMSEFSKKVEELHKDGNVKFAQEFGELDVFTEPKSMKGVTSNLSESGNNRRKNRFTNILPYDQTIVQLQPLIDDDGDDHTYINANYIPGYSSQKEYIATQNALFNTIDDYWRMIWEQNVSIIVKMTSDDNVCINHEYFLSMELNIAKQFGDLDVQISSFSTINKFYYREFKISKGEITRTVKHFQLFDWTHLTTDEKRDALIDFIDIVRRHTTGQDNHPTIIVQCMSGVARTGMFIAVDYMMQFIADHDWNATIDIFDLVYNMRKCRNHMVHFEIHYILIYDCVKELLDKKRKKEHDEEETFLLTNK